jgi:hypothetical protein
LLPIFLQCCAGVRCNRGLTETSLLNEALEHGVGGDLDLVSRTLQAAPQGDIGLHIAARSYLSDRDFQGGDML